MKYNSENVCAEIAELINTTGSANTRTAEIMIEMLNHIRAAESEIEQVREANSTICDALEAEQAETALLRKRVARLYAHVYAIEILLADENERALAEYSKGKAPYWEGYSDGLDEAAQIVSATPKEEGK